MSNVVCICFLLQNYPSVQGYRTKRIRNVEKLRYLFSGVHATGRMSFSPGMSSIAKVTSKMKSVRVGSDEGRGDSAEVDKGNDEEVQFQPAEESRSPPRTSHKRKSEGHTSESSKRQAHLEASTELVRLMQVKYLKEVEVKSEASIYDKVASRLEELPLVTEKGPSFMFHVMEQIRINGEMEYFLSFKNEAVAWCYITSRISEAGLGYLL